MANLGQYRVATSTTTFYMFRENGSWSTWDVGTTYALNDIVFGNGAFWKSLQNGNTGNSPTENSWWTAEPESNDSKSLEAAIQMFRYKNGFDGSLEDYKDLNSIINNTNPAWLGEHNISPTSSVDFRAFPFPQVHAEKTGAWQKNGRDYDLLVGYTLKGDWGVPPTTASVLSKSHFYRYRYKLEKTDTTLIQDWEYQTWNPQAGWGTNCTPENDVTNDDGNQVLLTSYLEYPNLRHDVNIICEAVDPNDDPGDSSWCLFPKTSWTGAPTSVEHYRAVNETLVLGADEVTYPDGEQNLYLDLRTATAIFGEGETPNDGGYNLYLKIYQSDMTTKVGTDMQLSGSASVWGTDENENGNGAHLITGNYLLLELTSRTINSNYPNTGAGFKVGFKIMYGENDQPIWPVYGSGINYQDLEIVDPGVYGTYKWWIPIDTGRFQDVYFHVAHLPSAVDVSDYTNGDTEFFI